MREGIAVYGKQRRFIVRPCMNSIPLPTPRRRSMQRSSFRRERGFGDPLNAVHARHRQCRVQATESNRRSLKSAPIASLPLHAQALQRQTNKRLCFESQTQKSDPARSKWPCSNCHHGELHHKGKGDESAPIGTSEDRATWPPGCYPGVIPLSVSRCRKTERLQLAERETAIEASTMVSLGIAVSKKCLLSAGLIYLRLASSTCIYGTGGGRDGGRSLGGRRWASSLRYWLSRYTTRRVSFGQFGLGTAMGCICRWPRATQSPGCSATRSAASLERWG
jgi:hypothetical protein